MTTDGEVDRVFTYPGKTVINLYASEAKGYFVFVARTAQKTKNSFSSRFRTNVRTCGTGFVFYLSNAEIVEEVEASTFGRTHRVYSCPTCESSLVLRDGELVSLGNQVGIIGQEHLSIDEIKTSETHPKGEEELVPC